MDELPKASVAALRAYERYQRKVPGILFRA